MTYRDEKETLRARVAELEQTVTEKDETIARLTGGAPPRADPGDQIERSRLLDAPSRVVFERELEHEISEEGFEDIAALLRTRSVNVSQVGRTLTGNGFSLACAKGRTRVTMSANYELMPIGALAMSGLAGGFTALVTFAITHDFFWRGLAEANFVWMAPLFIALSLPFTRRLAQQASRKSAKQLRATLEAVLELAKRHAVSEERRATPTRVRVQAPEPAVEVEVEAAPELDRAGRRPVD